MVAAAKTAPLAPAKTSAVSATNAGGASTPYVEQQQPLQQEKMQLSSQQIKQFDVRCPAQFCGFTLCMDLRQFDRHALMARPYRSGPGCLPPILSVWPVPIDMTGAR
jgi:hypothetical protein